MYIGNIKYIWCLPDIVDTNNLKINMNYATSDIEVFAFIVEQVHVHVHDLMYRQSWKIGEI